MMTEGSASAAHETMIKDEKKSNLESIEMQMKKAIAERGCIQSTLLGLSLDEGH